MKRAIRTTVTAIAVALMLGVRPAWALPVEHCDKLQALVETAMDYRLQGVPAQQALRYARQARFTEPQMQIWTTIVSEIYDMPPRNIRGSNRADFLTELYAQCLAKRAS